MGVTPTGLVERMLAERIGLDPSSVGDALIARGVHARMAVLGLRSKAEYDRALVEHGDEVQALVEEVVVPESWFFRDDRPFEVLTGFARDGWLAAPARPPLAALSVPCAGGEEPYSISVTLLEAGLPAGRFRVDAADVSARALARAISGVYGANAFRGTGSPARSGYFRERDGAFTVDPALRSSVRFHLGNLLDPALFADRPPFDVVFCRNLLIYLDGEARARAFATLARLIADGGLLFLGHADRLDAPEETPFQPTGERGAFAFRKGEATASSIKRRPIPKPLASPLPLGEGPGARGVARPPASKVAPHGHRPTRHDPHPGPLPGGEGGRKSRAGEAEKPPIESPSTILDRASSLADLGRYDEATALVEGSIAGGNAGAPAYFLLGLIAQVAGHRDRAEAHLLKAIYLDPRHDEVLLALALLARRKGDIAGEAAYRKRAERVLARKAAP
jgi:chemotaxis protein methyltransferase WspC